MLTLKNPTEPTFASGIFVKRIGSTIYKVSVHFNQNAKETMNDKVLRMVKNDLRILPENVTITSLQTEWLPERSSI